MHEVRGHRGTGQALLIIAGILLGSLLMACNPEPYGDCSLPRSEAIDNACGTADDPEGSAETAKSCVVNFVFECESRYCASYEGSTPFCTEACSDSNGDGVIDSQDDASCPDNGACVEFIPGKGEFFCIPPKFATNSDFNNPTSATTTETTGTNTEATTE